jgi:hypothetical protein
MKKEEIIKNRIIMSYKLMLDFYGMELKNEEGDIQRTLIYKKRYENLEINPHNNLRITRIIKFMTEFGFEKYPPKLLKFIMVNFFNL